MSHNTEAVSSITPKKKTQYWDEKNGVWYVYKDSDLWMVWYSEDPHPDIEIVKRQPDLRLLKNGNYKPVNYISNSLLLEQIELSKAAGEMTPELVDQLRMIVQRIGTRWNFKNYSYLEDMKAHAIVNLVANWHKFDAEKSSNPFSYYTASVFNSFRQILNKERKSRELVEKIKAVNNIAGANTYLDDSDYKEEQPDEITGLIDLDLPPADLGD